MTQANQVKVWKLLAVPTVAVALLAMLMLTLASCEATTTGSQSPLPPPGDSTQTSTVTATDDFSPLPHRLTVITVPRGVALIGKGVVHPNGLAYIISRSGYVMVVKGTKLVDVIALPHPEKSRSEPRDLVVNPRNGYVYVADQIANAVHIIDGTTIITSLSSMGKAPILVTVDPTSGYVYVANALGIGEPRRPSVVAVISDTEVIAQIDMGFIPHDMEYNATLQRVYVGRTTGTVDLGEALEGILTVISGTEVLTTTFLGPQAPGAINRIAIDELSGAMYLFKGNTLVYWDGNRTIKQLPLYERGYFLDSLTGSSIDIDPKRGWAYVGSWDGPPSHVIVAQQDQIIAEIPVEGFDARGVTVDQTHDYVYVAHRLSGTMSVIRGTEVMTTLATGGLGSSYVTVDEQRGYIYVSNADYGANIAVFGFEDAANKP